MASKNYRKNDRKEECSEYITRVLRHANQALYYSDFGTVFAYGTLKNEMYRQVRQGNVVRLPKECPARFILPNWGHRPEYSCAIRTFNRGRVGRFDFLSYLQSLPWSDKLCVHDLRLCFMTYQLHWIGEGWTYCRQSRCYSRRFDLSYPVTVQCFDTGTVVVCVSCTSNPFLLDVDGLVSLLSLLGEVRNSLRAPCVPDPRTWLISQWHLNRDTEVLQGGGVDVYLTFKDFFDDSAQFYHKHSLDRMRAEVIQSPNQTIQQVFERILNRASNPKAGDG